MKAKEWLDRGEKATDPIDAFSSFWRGFNTLFFGFTGAQERDKIKAMLRHNISEATAEAIIHEYELAISYLMSQPVIDMRKNGRDTVANIQTFNLETNSLVKLQEIFMVIYQIRCNLEHGQKSPSHMRDIQLCQSALPLLRYVVNEHIKKSVNLTAKIENSL